MNSPDLIEIREIGTDVVIATICVQKILDYALIREIGEKLLSIPENGGRKIVLNISRVEFFSSAALNKLILFDRAVRKHGGRIRLCGMIPEVREIFTITRLSQMFEIDDTEDEALQKL